MLQKVPERTEKNTDLRRENSEGDKGIITWFWRGRWDKCLEEADFYSVTHGEI